MIYLPKSWAKRLQAATAKRDERIAHFDGRGWTKRRGSFGTYQRILGDGHLLTYWPGAQCWLFQGQFYTVTSYGAGIKAFIAEQKPGRQIELL